jgi:ZIP family zinc transporter
MIESQFVQLFGENRVVWGLVGGLVIAGMNLVGALPILVWRNPSQKGLDTSLGFAGGVMVAAAFTSLLIPAIEQYGNLLTTSIGFVLGVGFLAVSGYWVPYVQRLITGKTGEAALMAESGVSSPHEIDYSSGRLAGVVVFIIAITLHNMPEGLAVGVGFGSGNLSDTIPLMIAIGTQNIPEGFAVAVAARNAGLGSLWYACVTGLRAGAVEIPIAVFGAAAVTVAEPLLPYAMGFAAGRMLYVIVNDIVPQTHDHGHDRTVTLGTMVGLLLMLSLDIALA